MLNNKYRLSIFAAAFFISSFFGHSQAITITETQWDVGQGEFTEENAGMSDQDTLQKTHPDHLYVESKVYQDGAGWVDTDGPMWGGLTIFEALTDQGEEWWAYNGNTTIGLDNTGAGYLDMRWKDEYEFHPAFDGWFLDRIELLVGKSDVSTERVNYRIRIEVLSNDWNTWTTLDMNPDSPGVTEFLEGGSNRAGVGTKIIIDNIAITDFRGIRVTADRIWQAEFNNDGTPITNRFWGCTEFVQMDVYLTDTIAGVPSNDFTGGVTRPDLDDILSKGITILGMAVDDHLVAYMWDSNMRMVRNLVPNYIARAAFTWGVHVPVGSYTNPEDAVADDEAFYTAAKNYAELVHLEYPDTILEGCIFETAYAADDDNTPDRVAMGPPFNGAGVEQIPIPEWVFEEFGEPNTPRNFSYDDMVYVDGRYDDHWLPGTNVPDITRKEAQMWYYYRARRYIDAGYEALHLGQIMPVTENDVANDFAALKSVIDRIRNYAADNARRHWVFLNAHTPATAAHPYYGIAVNGELLFDFHAMPLRPKEVIGSPYDAILEINHLDSIYGRSLGGISPSGWSCANLPYFVEFDNSIGWDPANPNNLPNHSDFWVWGWDESTWFSQQSDDYRNYWLWYATNWLRDNDPNGFLFMPGTRPIYPRPAGSGQLTWMYRANTFAADNLEGFNQEETIDKIWNSGCTDYSLADITGDCEVNLLDFLFLAEQWAN